jgi:hypothetical protein
MSKVYYEVINTYGNFNGGEIANTGVIEDTKENREGLLDEWSESHSFNDKVNKNFFIDGHMDSIAITLDDRDYNKPTGRYIIITTYETKKEEIERRYKADMKALNSLFGISTNQ